MKRDIAVFWAEVLLSNPDVQGKGSLEPTKYTRCCLGILNDLSGIPNGHLYALNNPAIKAWSGLKSGNGFIRNTSLAYMNDSEGKSFEDIALFIEKHSEEL